MGKFFLFTLSVFSCLIIFQSRLTGQYYREQVTEKSFEQSELYFNSYFLNPYGLLRWKQVSEGLFDDPFLRLHLNPANLPDFGKRRSLIYLDFRSDRTEPAIITDYRTYQGATAGMRYIPSPPYDPRWYSLTRSEPEPIFSLGVLIYPAENLFLGGTFQLIHKNEDFYRIPSWIYYPVFGYDAFGALALEGNDIPIIDRDYGQNEMTNSAQLYSAFLGYRFSEKFQAGLSLNGVNQSRDGAFTHSSQDEYNSTDNNDWFNFRTTRKTQNYDHIDYSGGIHYYFTPNFSAGVKAGYLSGEAKQKFIRADSSRYKYGDFSELWNWSRNFYRSSTNQGWDHDGNTAYGRISGNYKLPGKSQISFYYQYAKTSVDLRNTSTILDTGYYESRWNWDTTYYAHRNYSSLKDTRSGRGSRENKRHRSMINFKWQLTPKNSIYAGIYYGQENFLINSVEPVVATRYSEHFHFNGFQNPDSTTQLNRLFEDKELNWNYESRFRTIQIPIVVHFQFNKYWGMWLGVNRIMNYWTIKEQTIAVFNRRVKTINDSTSVEKNFGERYTQPTQKITEDFTDLIANFEVALSEQLKINLLIDPEFDETFRIAQWWLSFRANL